MDIGPDLQNSLADLIVEAVPIAETYEGRDTLLTGIPNRNRWTRSRENAHVDVMKIIGYVEKIFIGDTENIETWELLRFIDNAIHHVKGSSIERKLQELRKECIQCWERAKLLQRLPLEEPSRENPASTSLIPSLGNLPQPQVTLIPLSPSTDADLLTLEEQIPTPEENKDPITPFFEQASRSVEAAHDAMKKASAPFELVPAAAEPIECRQAIEQLGEVAQQLHILSGLLKNTSHLPKDIIPCRHLFTERIQFLTEQIPIAVLWISESYGMNKGLREKLRTIQQELEAFNIFVLSAEGRT